MSLIVDITVCQFYCFDSRKSLQKFGGYREDSLCSCGDIDVNCKSFYIWKRSTKRVHIDRFCER